MAEPQYFAAGNEFGICTVSLGVPQRHHLEDKLRAAAAAGFKVIDLFDECWAEYLQHHGGDPEQLWEPTEHNLQIARQLGQLVKDLGMRIICTQPLRSIEGHRDPKARQESMERVAKRFPFMRAFQTDLTFMCASVEKEPSSTTDYKVVARELAELGRLAEEYSQRDGGPMLRIAYEALSWARRNTWPATWEVVRAANRHNVGLIIDSFNILAVEYADPFHPDGHGRIHDTPEESLDVLRLSLASLVATVPGDRIFFVQLGDAELMKPAEFPPPTDPETPMLLPWSRGHRLYPLEADRGGYMPVDIVTAAVLATGYKGPLSLEVFNNSLWSSDSSVPASHAARGFSGLARLAEAVKNVPVFWGTPISETVAYRQWKEGSSASRIKTDAGS